MRIRKVSGLYRVGVLTCKRLRLRIEEHCLYTILISGNPDSQPNFTLGVHPLLIKGLGEGDTLESLRA